MKLLLVRRLLPLLGLGLVFFAEGQNYRLPVIPIEQMSTEVLDNGLTLAMTPHDAVPTVFVRAALLDAPDDQWHNLLANLSVRWLCKGSAQRSAQAEETLLNELRANLVPDGKGWSLNGPRMYAQELLDLSAAVLQHPTLDSAAFAMVLGEWQQQSKLAMEDPQVLSKAVADHWLFQDEADLAAWLDDPSRTDALREACLAFIDRYVRPNGLLLSVVGISAQDPLRDRLIQRLSSWQNGSADLPAVQPFVLPTGPQLALVQQPAATTFFRMMVPLEVQPGSKEWMAMDLLQTLFAGFPGSSLNRQLMREYRMPLGMLSGLTSWNGQTWFVASGALPNRDVPVIAGLVIEQLMALKTTPIPEDVLQQGKNWLIRLHQRKLEQPGEVATMLIRSREGGYDFDYYTNYAGLLAQITPADLVQLANRFFSPERLFMIAIGEVQPISAALAVLDAQGQADWYNSMGQPMDAAFFDKPEGLSSGELLERMIAANAGPAAQKNGKNWYFEWEGNLDVSPVRIAAFRSATTGLDFRVSLDGAVMHEIHGTPGDFSAMVLEEQQELDPLTQQLLGLQPLLFPEKLPLWREAKVVWEGIAEMEGHKTYVLQLTRPDNFSYTAYVDAATYLLRGLKKAHPGGVFEIRFFDHRDIQGLLLPHRMVIKGIGPYPLTFRCNRFQTNLSTNPLEKESDK